MLLPLLFLAVDKLYSMIMKNQSLTNPLDIYTSALDRVLNNGPWTKRDNELRTIETGDMDKTVYFDVKTIF